MDYRLDDIDRRILYYLTQDARNVSAPMIAEEVDVSPGTIRNRIKRLHETGIIRGYHADVDYERAAGYLTYMYRCTAPILERGKLATDALEVSGVVNVRELMSGRQNLHVVAVGSDSNDITRIARDLSKLGIEIEEEDLVESEHYHPYHPFGPSSEEQRPITDFLSLAGGAEVAELTVGDDAPIAGMSLEAADAEGLLEGVLVLAIERDGDVVTPRGETTVEGGDVVTLFSRGGVEEETVSAFTDAA